MEAKDYKIGNWVFDAECESYYFQIEEIRKYVGSTLWAYYRNGSIKSKEPDPVPLTEEWLIKFGYKKQAYRGVWYHPDLNNTPAMTIEEDGFYYQYTKIEYVHHLQNLCFVLALQELKLKQP